jgi:Domain of unknown function (DUF4915)
LTDKQDNKTNALRYIYSASFLDLLATLNISLFISTYQAGKLIVVRASQDQLTTIARNCDRVMGIAVKPDRLAVGTRREICFWENRPELPRHCRAIAHCDACFVPANSLIAGDLGLRELAWGNDTLWIASTRFSGLFAFHFLSRTSDRKATPSPPYLRGDEREVNPDLRVDERGVNPKSIWHPPFITAFKAEDRCHLNGIAMVDGDPKYVTVLGETNYAEGWRDNQARGGCLIEVPSGEIVARGLSMPHSPRVYDRRLWLLDSGWGRLVVVDSDTGKCTRVAEFPGFTRGLAFCDRYAFIGLSQIRDRATFSGLPLNRGTQRLECAVWVLNIDTGKSVGFLKFHGDCTELFDVQVLHDYRKPTVLGED